MLRNDGGYGLEVDSSKRLLFPNKGERMCSRTVSSIFGKAKPYLFKHPRLFHKWRIVATFFWQRSLYPLAIQSSRLPSTVKISKHVQLE